MSGAPQPPVIPEPFANHADPAFITTIPDTTGVSGRASYNLGFPPLTMQPVAGGGKPPFGQDVNGILFALSSHDFYVQSGVLFLFNAAVSTAMGGYAVGTLLGSTDRKTVWFNTQDANTTDPDGGSAAGWVSLFSSGFQPFAGLTGGTLTLTATQAARKIITLAGVLTSNLAVVLPTWSAPAGRWLFINNTTGAFNVTAKTASGTGVNIPQGGPSNPMEVYGDGTNIYPTVAPLGVPIDQNPTPLTLAERTNSGYLLATYFNQSSGAENPTIGYVMVANNSDGAFFRKITPANFAAQIGLSSFAGQVTAGQVPLSAVIQYAANILASATLTGTPTAPTAAVGTSSSQVATTAFANPSQSKAATGFVELPGGVFLQWGTIGPVSDPGNNVVDVAISFPTAFPNSCVFGVCTSNRSVAGSGQAASGSGFTTSRTRFGMTCSIDSVGGGVASGVWFAVGI